MVSVFTIMLIVRKKSIHIQRIYANPRHNNHKTDYREYCDSIVIFQKFLITQNRKQIAYDRNYD